MATPRMQPMYDYYKNMPKHPVGTWSAQCAIRLAKTLHQVGVYDPASYRRSGYANDSGWALRAEERIDAILNTGT